MDTYETNLETKAGDVLWTVPDGNPCHSPSGNVIIAKEHVAATAGICGYTVAKNVGNDPLAGQLGRKAYCPIAKAKDPVSARRCVRKLSLLIICTPNRRYQKWKFVTIQTTSSVSEHVRQLATRQLTRTRGLNFLFCRRR